MNEKAEQLLEQFELDLALKFADRALELDGSHVGALETKALVCLELDHVDEARTLLLTAAELQPESGASKFMYLGQLAAGAEAVDFLRKGAALMEASLAEMRADPTCPPEEAAMCAADAAAAYCAVAEVYLTELCEEADAQEQCEASVQAALRCDANSAQAMQTMASVCISACRPDDAREWLRRSLAAWHRPGASKGHAEEHKEEEEEKEETEEVEGANGSAAAMAEDEQPPALPPYDVRVSTAKLLIELEMLQEAVEVLEQLVEEDDEVVRVWYLLGWALVLAGDKTAAAETLQKAKALFVQVHCDEAPILEHTEELLAQLEQGGAGAAGDAMAT